MKMKSLLKSGSKIFIAAVAALAFSCSIEPRIEGETAPSLGLHGFKAVSGEVASINVRVSGPGISRSETFSSGTEKIVIPLPEADNVRFDVEAEKKSVGSGPVYSYGEASYADLRRGETTEIDILMKPYETKVLIPDFGDGRVLQLDDLNVAESYYEIIPSGWEEFSPSASPNDAAIDGNGRIWISQESGAVAAPLIRINDITDSSPLSTSAANIDAIAYDRKNGFLYYVDGPSRLGRIDTGPDVPGSPQILDPVPAAGDGILSSAVAVDSEGHVYYMVLSSPAALYKYDPGSDTLLATYSDSDFGFSTFDILVKNNHVYVLNPDGPDGKLVIKLTKGLGFAGSFGSTADPNVAGGFYRPTRFAAPTSRDIYVIDDGAASDEPYANRIIRFSDIDASGWKVFSPFFEDLSGTYQGEVLSLWIN